jgi:predicted RNA-binding protein YlxR (DUF448 family)
MMDVRAYPERTCIGCRQRSAARELARMIAPMGAIVFTKDRGAADQATRAAGGRRGRGAWLHPREECMAKAVKAGSFARAFKRAIAEVKPELLRAKMHRMIGPTRNVQGDLR